MMKIFLLLLIFFITSCTTPIGGAKKVDDIKPQETPSIESIEVNINSDIILPPNSLLLVYAYDKSVSYTHLRDHETRGSRG